MEERYKFYYSIGRLFNSSLGIKMVLDIVLSRVIEEMGVEAGLFWIYDSKSGHAVCTSCQSPGGSGLKGTTISFNYGVKGYSMRNRKPLIVNDLSLYPWFRRDFDNSMGIETRNLLLIPLMTQQKLIGLLELINKTDSEKPFTRDDVDMLEPLASTAAMALDNIDMFTGMAERERMKKELEFSSFLQSAILPMKTLTSPYFEMRSRIDSSKELGGDFYDWRQLDEDKYLFLIGDVSGQGNPSAIFMAITRSILWTLSQFFFDPQKICEKTNEFLIKSTRIDMFVTLLLLVVDVKKMTMKFVSCGHNAGIIIRKNGEKYTLKTKGLPLGVNETSVYEQKEIALQEADLVVLYTDGITETINKDEDAFGEKRFEKLLLKYRQLDVQEIINRVFSKIESYAGGRESSDDRCMLAIKFAEGVETASAPAKAKLRSFKLDISKLEEVMKMLEHVEKLAMNAGLSREETNDILISTEETCVNVIRYALPPEKIDSFEVQSWVVDDTITVVVKDRGIPFDPTRFMESHLDPKAGKRDAGGYGLLLIKQLVDEVNYHYDEEKGNITTLIKKKKEEALQPKVVKEFVVNPTDKYIRLIQKFDFE